MRLITSTIAGLLIYTGIYAQEQGTVQVFNIPAPSIANAILEDIDSLKIGIYLPPTYFINTEKHYPVAYFLLGYDGPVELFTDLGISGYKLGSSMDYLIGQGKTKEMIMVIISGSNRLLGSYYVNSPVTGNWEDFVTNDAIEFLDHNYRTIDSNSARALGGHSMGGFGALNITMKHPDKYCIGYGISPGLFDKTGLFDMYSFASDDVIENFLDIQESIDTLPKEEAHAEYMSTIDQNIISDYETVFTFAYGSAFAPSPDSVAPYIYFPYSRNGSELVFDSLVAKKWDNGFGNLEEKVNNYADNLKSLKCTGIDCGLNDGYAWIVRGSAYYNQLLTDNEIPHVYNTHTGDHGNRLKERIEKFYMAICDSIMEFDTANLNTATELLDMKSNNIVSGVVDGVQKSIHLILKPTTDLFNFKPSIYISAGGKVSPQSGSVIDLTSGEVWITITAEDGMHSEQWKLTYEKEVSGLNSPNLANAIELTFLADEKLLNYQREEYSGIITIKIFNLQGSEIINEQLMNEPSGTIDLNQLTSGVYIYSIECQNSIQSGEIVVQ